LSAACGTEYATAECAGIHRSSEMIHRKRLNIGVDQSVTLRHPSAATIQRLVDTTTTSSQVQCLGPLIYGSRLGAGVVKPGVGDGPLAFTIPQSVDAKTRRGPEVSV
jgi:hypothetical protein